MIAKSSSRLDHGQNRWRIDIVPMPSSCPGRERPEHWRRLRRGPAFSPSRSTDQETTAARSGPAICQIHSRSAAYSKARSRAPRRIRASRHKYRLAPAISHQQRHADRPALYLSVCLRYRRRQVAAKRLHSYVISREAIGCHQATCKKALCGVANRRRALYDQSAVVHGFDISHS